MDEIVDFTNCKRVYRHYGGTDQKISVKYKNDVYMIKFEECRNKTHDYSSSHINNITSEYICSHICNSMGVEAHQTILGTYDNNLVVGCLDFRKPGDHEMEFVDFMRSVYKPEEIKKIPTLNQIYETIKAPINNFSEEMQQMAIKRYWDMFVVDALVGNFDRHIENWSYLVNDDDIRLSPVYDFGSSLFPQLSDEGGRMFANKKYELLKRCYVFPSPDLCLTRNKNGKLGYRDLMISGYDKNLSEAIIRVVPRVDLEKINKIIDNAPLVTDGKKMFYKNILKERKTQILDKAYECCLTKTFDKDAYDRVINETQFTEKMLKQMLSQELKGQSLQSTPQIGFTKEFKQKLKDNSFTNQQKISSKSIVEYNKSLSEQNIPTNGFKDKSNVPID